MHKRSILPMLYMVFITSVVNSTLWSTNTNDDKLMNLFMRSMGHEVLLTHGDSASRILPITHEGNQYVIGFDREFKLVSSILIEAVDKAVRRHNIATDYLVEMEDCDTKEITYSYLVNEDVDLSSIACGSREKPLACYNLRFLILDNSTPTLHSSGLSKISAASSFSWYPWVVVFCGGVGLIMLVYRRRAPSATHLLALGEFTFDTHLMKLSREEVEITLTSTESALLTQLASSANTTIKRDDLLHHVWGDKDDYIGRTLDVFISKLRKKLKADPTIKITNVKGVGYRLVLG